MACLRLAASTHHYPARALITRAFTSLTCNQFLLKMAKGRLSAAPSNHSLKIEEPATMAPQWLCYGEAVSLDLVTLTA